MSAISTSFWTRDRIMNLFLTLGIGTVVVLLIRYLSAVLLPFFIACFLAYLLQPLVELNCRLFRLKGRAIASILALLDIIVIVTAVIYLFLPSVVKELDEMGNIIHGITSGKIPLPPIYQNLIEGAEQYLNVDYLRDFISGRHFSAIINGGQSILEEMMHIILWLVSVLLTIIYVLFILIDYPQIATGFKLLAPRKYRRAFLSVFAEVSTSMNHYFRGQGIVALCAVVLYCIGFSIVGLPLALPMGVLVGLLFMIPYFQYVTVIPVAIICFIYSLGGNADFLPMLGKCGLVYLISQSICDYVITPHVMRKEIGLNPAVILLALSVWGSLLGIIGMIIALPLTSLIMTYYKRYISEPENITRRISATAQKLTGQSDETDSDNGHVKK